jgi:hypothetical protein
LASFRNHAGSQTAPEETLIRYCKQVLGSIEGLHVDFKQKHDRRHAKLEDDDKRNLAKAVSGFANSSGGVLIWGIADKQIIPKPIRDVEEYIDHLNELAPQVTDPTVPGIQSSWIPADSDSGSGFGLIHIPESELPPHRVILKYDGLQGHYFLRSGSVFIEATHTQLEDMFGRRPKPVLEFSMRLHRAGHGGGKQHFYLVLGILNKGRGSARAPYLAVNVSEPYRMSEYGIDGNRHFGLNPLLRSHGIDEARFGSISNIVIHPGVTLDVSAIDLKIPFEAEPEEIQPVEINFKVAAENFQLTEGTAKFSSKQIWRQLPKDPRK